VHMPSQGRSEMPVVGGSSELILVFDARQVLTLLIHSIDRNRPSKMTESTVVEFYCAQCEGKQRTGYIPIQDLSRKRSSGSMQRFDCDGQLLVTINHQSSNQVRIRMQHLLNHLPYCDIAIDDQMDALIKTMSMCPPSIVRVSPTVA
jgi:hypothetical protein